MDYAPDPATFAAAYESGRPQVVWTRLVADVDTPVSAMLKLAGGQPNSFLLESVEGGAVRGRYSLLGFKPDLIWRCRRGQAEINRRARYEPDAFTPLDSAPLDSLRQILAESRIAMPPGIPPMSAGLVGYMGYDMVREMERIPDGTKDELGVPDGLFMRPTVVAVFDNIEDSLTIVTPVWPDGGLSARAAHAQACERLADVVADFDRALPTKREIPDARDAGQMQPASDEGPSNEPASNMSYDDYVRMVEAGRAYVAAGDVFQVVLSQRFSRPFTLPPFALYRALRRINPSPFLVYLDAGDFAIVTSSPELLVRLRDNTVTIRPIAGTRPRGRAAMAGALPNEGPATDEELAADMLSDPKELAEHLMLLDLGRNDVGRVAEIGSVNVTARMSVEYYSHVMHMVSNVEGKLAARHDAIDALVAGFPAGTVSGAPKVRAMEIIEELEPSRRGVYAGCLGYFAANGDMDNCIALRTAVIKDGVMHVQAGGGIVYDSDPATEYEETQSKARALFRAAEAAARFADGR
ncbi:MAG: anthranilate synthase component I [Alphaproteobacteria bacterium]